MKLLLAGGGTAGHINPALAIADYVTAHEKNVDVLYVGAKGKMEEHLVKAAGYNFKSIEISGFSRKISIDGLKKNLKTAKLLFTSSKESKKILKEFNPDICIGTGGYVSGPIIREAQKLNIPTLIHEQNAYPGVTNKMLSKKAKCTMLAVEDAKKYLDKGCKTKVTGNPIRKSVLEISRSDARKQLKLDSRPLILSFGGSLGARKINEAVAELMVYTAKQDKYQHIHAYGQYGKWFVNLLEEKGIKLSAHKNFDVREYINDMPICLQAADLVICRAGAITLSEIEAAGKVSILIPSPNVAENHQYHNAIALVNKDAAYILQEKDLTGQSLIDMVISVMSDKQKYSECQKNVKEMAAIDADKRIYNVIKKTI